jgi:putative endonuclease
MASKRNGTLYLGCTSNLTRRTWEHRTGAIEGFTKKYGCNRLVWFEGFANLHDARAQEARMKRWRRTWKLRLIELANPDWDDLYQSISQ